jgi:hypothetical protein
MEGSEREGEGTTVDCLASLLARAGVDLGENESLISKKGKPRCDRPASKSNCLSAQQPLSAFGT